MANIKVFEDKKIRTEWDAEKEDWWFSVHDVVQVLSDCKDVRDYIKKMRKRDEQLNLNWGTICPLHNKSTCGTYYKDNLATRKTRNICKK